MLLKKSFLFFLCIVTNQVDATRNRKKTPATNHFARKQGESAKDYLNRFSKSAVITQLAQSENYVLLDEKSAENFSLLDYTLDDEPETTQPTICIPDETQDETKQETIASPAKTPSRRKQRRRKNVQTTPTSTLDGQEVDSTQISPSSTNSSGSTDLSELTRIYRDLKIYSASKLRNPKKFKATLDQLQANFPHASKNPIVDEEKKTTLLIALIYNDRLEEENLPYLKLLVPVLNEDEINSKDAEGDTAVEIAVRSEEEQTFITLLKNDQLDITGNNLTSSNNKEVFSLFSFVAHTCPKFLPTLLMYRPEVVNTQNKYGETPLMSTIMYSNYFIHIAKLLAHSYVDVNIQDNEGKTAVHHAIAKHFKHKPHTDMTDTITKILARHDTIAFTDDDGHTAYTLALILKKFDIAQILKEKRPDEIYAHATVNENLKTKYGIRATKLHPLALLAVLNQSKAIQALLDDGGTVHVDTITNNENNYTALHYAAVYNRSDAAIALLERSANPNVQSTAGRTPLMIAFSGQEMDQAFFYAFLDHPKFDMTISNKQGRTVLHYACRYNFDKELALLLLRYPQETPHASLCTYAAKYDAEDCVTLLDEYAAQKELARMAQEDGNTLEA